MTHNDTLSASLTSFPTCSSGTKDRIKVDIGAPQLTLYSQHIVVVDGILCPASSKDISRQLWPHNLCRATSNVLRERGVSRDALSTYQNTTKWPANCSTSDSTSDKLMYKITDTPRQIPPAAF